MIKHQYLFFTMLLAIVLTNHTSQAQAPHKEVQGSLRQVSGPVFQHVPGERLVDAVASAGGGFTHCPIVSGDKAKMLCFNFPQQNIPALMICRGAKRSYQPTEFHSRSYHCYVYGNRQLFTRKIAPVMRQSGLR